MKAEKGSHASLLDSAGRLLPQARDQDRLEADLPKAVGYVRGSTDEQVNTLEAQANQIHAYCDSAGLGLPFVTGLFRAV